LKDSQHLFEGLKVVDAASFIAGPSAATIMADFGAEVIKIEPPEVGDSLRWLITNGRMPEGKENYCWELTSRNKKSLSLNLKEPEALKILQDLVISADVFVTNMPFPVRKKLKIKLLIGTANPNTTTTAIPRPMAGCIRFEIARKVHMPRKKLIAIFSMKTAFIKILRYSSTIS